MAHLTPDFNHRLYEDLAWLWPVISPPEDYIEEAEQFIQAIQKHSKIPARSLLHLGCGGGHIDHTLQKHVPVTGVDRSPAMLSLARKLNPELEYLNGDMRSIRLDKVFDAVIIADSIDYMLTEDELRASFISSYLHLKPGGVFCTYAEETRDLFKNNQTYTSFHTAGDLDVTLIENYYDPDPHDTTYEMTFLYLLRQSGKLTIEYDRHLMGLFSKQTWLDLLQEIGFDIHQEYFEEADAPLFVGIKPFQRLAKRYYKSGKTDLSLP